MQQHAILDSKNLILDNTVEAWMLYIAPIIYTQFANLPFPKSGLTNAFQIAQKNT